MIACYSPACSERASTRCFLCKSVYCLNHSRLLPDMSGPSYACGVCEKRRPSASLGHRILEVLSRSVSWRYC
jgi:hypothetical protein